MLVTLACERARNTFISCVCVQTRKRACTFCMTNVRQLVRSECARVRVAILFSRDKIYLFKRARAHRHMHRHMHCWRTLGEHLPTLSVLLLPLSFSCRTTTTTPKKCPATHPHNISLLVVAYHFCARAKPTRRHRANCVNVSCGVR